MKSQESLNLLAVVGLILSLGGVALAVLDYTGSAFVCLVLAGINLFTIRNTSA